MLYLLLDSCKLLGEYQYVVLAFAGIRQDPLQELQKVGRQESYDFGAMIKMILVMNELVAFILNIPK